MSLNDPTGNIIDLSQAVLAGVTPGLVAINTENSLTNAVVGSNLDYNSTTKTIDLADSISINNLTISGEVTGELIPSVNIGYNLGSVTKSWLNGYIESVICDNITADIVYIGSLDITLALTVGGDIVSHDIRPNTTMTNSIGSSLFKYTNGYFDTTWSSYLNASISTITGALFSGNGTSSNPSISFTTDSDTGLFLNSANVLGVTAGGVSAATVTGGYVTLANAPTSNMHVANKQYVDNADDLKVSKTGDTMTGTLNSRSIIPTLDVSYVLGSSLQRWNQIYGNYLSAVDIACSNNLQIDGTTYTNNIAPVADNTETIGAVASRYASINAVSYNSGANVLLSGNTLGSTITASSLTSLGTLVGGVNIASAQTYKINGVNVLSSSTLGSSVVTSSLTSLGTLVGGVNIASAQTYKINGVNVLSSSTLGSGVTASSLTSLGTLTALNVAGNILPTTTNTRTVGSSALSFASMNSTVYAIGTNTVLSAGVLGSTITASSLTSVGALTSLSMNGDITPATTNIRRLGTASNKWLSAAITTTNTDNIDPIVSTTLNLGPNAVAIVTGNTSVNSSTTYSLLTTTTGTGTLNFNDGSNSGAISYNHSTDTMTLTAGGNAFCAMQTAGDDMMLIGTSSLDRVGLRVYRPNSTTSSIFRLYSDNGSVNSIQMRVGATGIIYAQSTSITSISDRRKKKDIIPTDTSDYLDRFEAIGEKLCGYKWKRSDDHQCYGLIAQEMEELDPQYVTLEEESLIDEDGAPSEAGTATKALNGDYLHHILRGAVYQLVKKNKELENRINILENKLYELI